MTDIVEVSDCVVVTSTNLIEVTFDVSAGELDRSGHATYAICAQPMTADEAEELSIQLRFAVNIARGQSRTQA